MDFSNNRRNWLFSFIFYTYLNYRFNLLSMPFEFFLAASPLILLWVWCEFYCSYQKRGTGFLLYRLFSIPLEPIVCIILIDRTSADALFEKVAQSWITACLFCVASIWHWLNCLSYYFENDSIKEKEKSQEAEKVAQILESTLKQLSAIRDPEALDKALYRALMQCPEYEPVIIDAYEKQKQFLLGRLGQSPT